MKYLRGMLYLLISVCVTLTPNVVHAQSIAEYNVLGSFVYQNDIYNYTFKQTSNGSSSFLIEQVEGITPDTLKATEKKLKDLKAVIIKNSGNLKIDSNSYKKHIDSIMSLIDKGAQMFKSSNRHLDSLLSPLRDTLKKYTAKDSSKAKIMSNIVSELSAVKILTQQITDEHKPQLISNMSIENFRELFKSQLKRFVDPSLVNKDSKEIDVIATDKYIEIQARLKFKDDQPLTAYLQLLSKQVNVYTENEPKPTRLPIVMNIDDIQFEFESGTIKNIYAQFSKVGDPEQKYFFQNTIPISISGKFAPTQFYKHLIFAINPRQIQNGFKENTDPTDNDIYFRLGEVVRYVLFLETQKEDYSPEDKVYHLSSLQSSVELKKQLRSKILTVKAFTDFNGISDNKPNGLIQFEANIHANIVTYHKQVGKTNFAFVSGTDFLFTLNKIDDNNKYLQLKGDALDKNQLANNIKMFGIRPVDVLRYQSSSINVNTNLIKFSIPDFASSMSLNASYGILLTNVSDSLKVEGGTFTKIATADQRSIYSRNFSTNLSIDFSPDSRYGFRISYGGNWLSVKNSEVSLVSGSSNRLNVLEFSGFLKTNDDAKLFFRWRSTSEFHQPENSYNQVQLGYIVDIFKANK